MNHPYSLRALVESLLFVAGRGVRFDQMASVLKVSVEEVQGAVRDLQFEYESLQRPKAIRLQVTENSAEMMTDALVGSYVEKLLEKPARQELSESGLETLSILAYRGPISRVELEDVRGVNCAQILRNLCIRGLVEECSDSTGTYQVTEEFLKHMGISEVEELPAYEEMRSLSLEQVAKEAEDAHAYLGEKIEESESEVAEGVVSDAVDDVVVKEAKGLGEEVAHVEPALEVEERVVDAPEPFTVAGFEVETESVS